MRKREKKAGESSLDLSLSIETNDDTYVFTKGIYHVVQAFSMTVSKLWSQKLMKIYKLSSSTKDA